MAKTQQTNPSPGHQPGGLTEAWHTDDRRGNSGCELNPDALQVAIEAALFHVLLDIEVWGTGTRINHRRERTTGTAAQNAWRRAMSAHITERVSELYLDLVHPESPFRMGKRRPETQRLAGAPRVGDILD